MHYAKAVLEGLYFLEPGQYFSRVPSEQQCKAVCCMVLVVLSVLVHDWCG